MPCGDCGAHYMPCPDCGAAVDVKRIDIFHEGKCWVCNCAFDEPCPTRSAGNEDAETAARSRVAARDTVLECERPNRPQSEERE